MKTVALGEVASFVRGITFKPADVVELGTNGSVGCMRTKNVQAELDLSDVLGIPDQFVKREEQYLAFGDTLISSANSWNLLGKCSWVPHLGFRSSFGGFVTVLRSHDAEVADPRYLYRWFSYGLAQQLLRSFGRKTTNISNLPIDRCRKMSLPLPPIEEQRRIAAILDAADAVRAKRRQALAKLDTLTQAIFIDMFGDPRSNDKGWPTTKFEELCPSHLGKMLDQKQQTGEHPRLYLRNTNVRWFEFDLRDVATMDFSESDREKYRLNAGDVLICEGGEPGRAAVWGSQLEECYFQKALHRGRPNIDLATAEFVVHLLSNLAAMGGLTDHISTATIGHLTGKRLKAMTVICPPLADQAEFSRVLKLVEQQRALSMSHQAASDDLFGSLQQRAFRGEL